MPSDVGDVYLAYFAARDDAYSIPIPGAKGWQNVKDDNGQRLPLTSDIIIAGLTRKGPPVSGYMLRPDNTTHVFAVDFDTVDGAAQAAKVQNAMADDGVPAYVAGSRRGAHLWCVGLDRMPAKVIRRALRAWLTDAGLPTDDPKIELRPASDEIYPDDQGRPGLGTCLRLPMMPNPKNGRMYPLTGVGGEKLGDSVSQILLQIEYARADAIELASSRWVQKIKPGDVPRSYGHRRQKDLPDNLSASAILAEHYGILNARPGKAVRCTRHDDRVASLSILRDDQRVICRGGGCELNNDGHGRGTVELLKMAGVEVPV